MSIYSYLQEQTFEKLRDRMLEYVPNDIDKSENSFIYTAISPVALFVADMFSIMKVLLDEAFLPTATGQNLDTIAATFPRVYRRSASKERLTALVVMEPGTDPLPWLQSASESGYYASNSEAVRFQLDTEKEGGTGYAVINDTNVYLYLIAENAGNIGSSVGEELQLTPTLEGATSCSIASVNSIGADAEDDETFRYRIWATLNNPFTGTLQAYYKMLFSDFPESTGGFPVDYGFVMPRGSSCGKIFVYAGRKDSDGYADGITEDECRVLQNYMDARVGGIGGFGIGAAPIGHHIYVDTIARYLMRLHVDLTFNITREALAELGADWKVLHSAVKTATLEYLNSLAESYLPMSNNFFLTDINRMRRSVDYSVHDHTSAIYEKIRKILPNNTKAIRNVKIYKKVDYFSHVDHGTKQSTNAFLRPDGIWIHKDDYKAYVVPQKDTTLSTTRNGKLCIPKLSDDSPQNESEQLLHKNLSVRILVEQS